MSDIAEQLRQLRTDLDNERRVRVCIQESQEFERSRMTAAEDAIVELTEQRDELAALLLTNTANIVAAKRICDGRRDANANALGKIQTEIEAVLKAHTETMFRLQQQHDALSARLHEYPDPGAICLLVENRPDRDDANPIPPIDAADVVVDSASHDTRRTSGPRPTVPAEQRLIR